MDHKHMIPLAEACKLYSLPHRYFSQLAREFRAPAVKIGARVYIPAEFVHKRRTLEEYQSCDG
jgi:hypothetical protein